MSSEYRLPTIEQVNAVVEAFAANIAAKGYEQKKNLKALAYVDSLEKNQLSAELQELINSKTDMAEVRRRIDSEIPSVFKAGGSYIFDDLPEPNEVHHGYVYNVLTDFTSTNDFIEGPGKKYSAGVSVVVVEESDGVYKYDVLSTDVDTSGFAKQEDMNAAREIIETYELIAKSDIDEIINSSQ